MKSILNQRDGYCYLCGRREGGDPLDVHHVFYGRNRANSEKYGLTVKLHHNSCHIFGENSVHQNAEVKRKMQADVQREAMKYYGWSVEDFIEIFGKSYI